MLAAITAGAVATAGAAYVLQRPPVDPPLSNIKTSSEVDPDTLPPPPAKGQHSAIHANVELPIRYAKKGVASLRFDPLVISLKKIAEASEFKDKPALKYEQRPYPADRVDGFRTVTWAEYYQQSRRFAKALISIGMKPTEAVAICGFNDIAWMFSHIGVMMAGGLSAGTYPTNSAELCMFVANDSNSVVAVCDTMANAEKFISKKSEMPQLKHVLVYTDSVPTEHAEAKSGFLMSFSDFLDRGDKADNDAELDARMNAIKMNTAASLIYTSGTTGNPKGVMLHHDNMMFMGKAGADRVELPRDIPQHRSVSYLPLSHIAAQLLDIIIPISYTLSGTLFTVHFARPDVMKGSLKTSLLGVLPTAHFGVPRVWQKFVEGIKQKSKENPSTGLKKMLVDWARSVGEFNINARQVGGDGVLARGTHIAEKLVFNKVKSALGLQHCTHFYTGAAPTSAETFQFLGSLGISLCEVYGMSESTGLGCASSPHCFKFGACGATIDGSELKLDHVEGRDKPGEGEVCYRGRQVMMGYLNNQEKTDEAIDSEGWLHSGDVGEWENGLLKIVGRIKELLISEGGENIAPVPIEDELKRVMPALSNVVMIGDKRKYNTILVTLKMKPNLDNGTFYDELTAEAKDVNPSVTTVAAAMKDDKWRQYIENGIKEYNKKAPSNAQRIQKFTILPTDLSIPGGELTPTMKLKRNVVNEMYAKEIEAMYS